MWQTVGLVGKALVGSIFGRTASTEHDYEDDADIGYVNFTTETTADNKHNYYSTTDLRSQSSHCGHTLLS